MPSVWVIEEGEYHRYSVIGIFSTKEKAEEILAQHRQLKGDAGFYWVTDEGARAVEWKLDPKYEELFNS